MILHTYSVVTSCKINNKYKSTIKKVSKYIHLKRTQLRLPFIYFIYSEYKYQEITT